MRWAKRKNIWIEMSIREISTQAHFAKLSYRRINSVVPEDNDRIFLSIHSFLSHSAMISKLLNAEEKAWFPATIGGILKISEDSVIHKRKFRNKLEHYDNELKKWINKLIAPGEHFSIGTYNIGPKSMIQVPNMIYVSHYNPDSNVFTFVNEDFNLGELFEEVERIGTLADNWVKKNC